MDQKEMEIIEYFKIHTQTHKYGHIHILKPGGLKYKL